jgi:FkbM family methyltransferase
MNINQYTAKLLKALELALDPKGLQALLTWPKFSLTSYHMLSALRCQGIRFSTLIDVGASVGQFTVAAAKLFPGAAIYAFEPLPDSMGRLKHHTRTLPGIQVYPLALGEKPGKATLHVNTYSLSSSLLPLGAAHRSFFPEARESNAITVEISTLDAVFNKVELASPVLLKLDVQGYETKVLAGGTETLRRVDHVILETSFKPLYEGERLFMEIARLMKGYGFRFLRPVGWLTAPETGEVLQMDALFEREH